LKKQAEQLRRQCLVLVVFLCNSFFLFSQPGKTIPVSFHPVFNGLPLDLERMYYLKSGDSIRFETLKFYISQIELINGDKTIWKEKNGYHLAVASDEKTMQVLLHPDADVLFNKIKFGLGIDSITNSSGAMRGDLDPTKGMYWTWQSGYINFKIEGSSNLCKSRNNEFQFHAGGYQFPFNCFRTIVLNGAFEKGVNIYIDLSEFMNDIDLAVEDHVMSPGEKAVELSKKLSGCFHVDVK